MKTICYISALLLFFTGSLTSCESKGEKKLFSEPAEIPLSEISDEVAVLFNENVARIGSSIFYECNALEKRIVDSCMMINCVEELPKANYDGTPFDFEYPAIDFDTYTLVIGQVAVDYHGNNYIASKSLVIEQNVITMNLTAVRELEKGVDYTTDSYPIPIYFWGLYPKIDAKSIHMDISYETKYI